MKGNIHRSEWLPGWHSTKPCCFVLLLFICSLGYAQAVPESAEECRNFDALADYLCGGSGQWIGENKNHDPKNERSPEAFGLWFERPLPVLLTLKIVAYMQDTVLISSQGTFNWHPIEQRVIHSMSDRGKGYSEGITTFPNDSTFISVMKIYRPDGSTYDHKDENFIVDEDTHRNTSFARDEDGGWKVSGNWVWKRKPE